MISLKKVVSLHQFPYQVFLGRVEARGHPPEQGDPRAENTPANQ